MTHESARATTSLSLLQRMRDGDEFAWQQFVQLYGPLCYSWCRKHGLNDDLAADVIQEVWQSVAQNLGTFTANNQGTFRGWLWTVTRSKAMDVHRRAQDKAAAAGGTTALQMLHELPADEPDDLSKVEQSHLLVRRVLTMLQPEFEAHNWQAFWRHAIDGRSASEVGAELGIKANAVYQAKFRVLKRLKEMLAGCFDSSEFA